MVMFYRSHFYCVFLGSGMYPFRKHRKFYRAGQTVTVHFDKARFTAMEHKVAIFLSVNFSLKPSLLAKLAYLLLKAKVLITESNLPQFRKKMVVILTKFPVKLASSNGNMGRAGANPKDNREKKLGN